MIEVEIFFKKMPELVIKTNVARANIRKTILQDLTQIVANMLGKPTKYVAIVLIPDLWMSFEGTEKPCATCHITSVNQFDAESNRKYSKKIMDYLVDALGVSNERMYLDFNRASREFMGYKSDTFYGLLGPSQ